MNAWNLLGIAPTSEINELKRAYIVRLSDVDREEQLDQVQLLRDAYGQALQEILRLKESQQEASKAGGGDAANDPEATNGVSNKASSMAGDKPDPDVHAVADAVMMRVRAVYAKASTRSDVAQWEQLLNQDHLWTLGQWEALNDAMLSFLTDHCFLPKPVWELLDRYFVWTVQGDELYDRYPEEFVDYMLTEINTYWSLRYDGFPDDFAELDRFAGLRNEAHNALIEDELEQAYNSMTAAQELYAEDPDLLRMFGTYYVRQGETAGAFAWFDRLVAADPDGLDGWVQRAEASLKLGRLERAAEDYRVILERVPDHLQALSGLARCYLSLGQLTEAKRLFQQTIDLYPFDLDSRVRMYEVNKRLADSKLAELSNHPDDAGLLFSLAELYFELESYEACCDILESSPMPVGLEIGGLLLWGRALRQRGMHKESLQPLNQAWESVRERGVDGYAVAMELGYVQIELKNGKAALRHLAYALAVRPDDAELLTQMAYAYWMTEGYAEAIEYATRAIELEPSKWFPYSIRGMSHYDLKNYREAIADHEVVLKHEYDFDEAWFRKGYCHMKLNHYASAVHCFEKAREWDYGDEIHYYLAGAYFYNRQYADALAAIRKCQEHDPEEPQGYVIEGDILRAMGDWSKATEVYMNASDRFPDDFYSCQMAVYTRIKQLGTEDYQRTLKYMENLGTFEDDDGWIYMETVRFLVNLKALKNSRLMIQKFMQERDDDDADMPSVCFYSGVMFYNEGKYAESIEHLEKAYQLGHRGQTSIYLSAAYYKYDDLKTALQYAELACKEHTDNGDYRQFHDQLHIRVHEPKWLGWLRDFFRFVPPLPDNIQLDHQEIDEVDEFHFTLDDE